MYKILLLNQIDEYLCSVRNLSLITLEIVRLKIKRREK